MTEEDKTLCLEDFCPHEIRQLSDYTHDHFESYAAMKTAVYDHSVARTRYNGEGGIKSLNYFDMPDNTRQEDQWD